MSVKVHIEDENDAPPGVGSGRGGAMGTPSSLMDEAPPGLDQEKNAVVSGGGSVGGTDDEEPSDEAEKSPSSQAP